MQKIIITASLFLLSFVGLYAQTTEEEYNYITKGYKIQIESGLDMKKGYNIKTLTDFVSLNFGEDEKDGLRGLTFKGLYRDLQSKPCAIMAIYERRLRGVSVVQEYYCLPIGVNVDSIWDKTFNQVNSKFNDDNAKKVYVSMLWATAKFASQEAAK